MWVGLYYYCVILIAVYNFEVYAVQTIKAFWACASAMTPPITVLAAPFTVFVGHGYTGLQTRLVHGARSMADIATFWTVNAARPITG